MTQRWHRPSWDYEGYGTYEFDDPMRGYGQLPAGVSIEDIISNMDAYVIVMGGIQVAKTEVQQPIMDTLDKMQFNADGPDTGPTIAGVASFMLFDLFGSDFASNYRKAGYAILGDKASVKGGNPRMLITKVATVISDNARAGGNYVVISIDPSLLAQAQSALSTPPPNGTTNGKTNGNGNGNGNGGTVTVPPGCYLDMEEKLVCPPPPPPPSQARAGTPEWVIPAVIGVGALALIAAVVTTKGK